MDSTLTAITNFRGKFISLNAEVAIEVGIEESSDWAKIWPVVRINVRDHAPIINEKICCVQDPPRRFLGVM